VAAPNKSCHPTPVERVVESCCPEPGVGALFRSAQVPVPGPGGELIPI
jgi:uncharacterized protein (DUF983 family)